MNENFYEDDFLKNLGSRIKILRVAQGLSQAQLADSINMSPRYLSEVEAGKRNISIYFLKLLAERLSISLSDLLNFTNKEERETILKELNKFLEKLSREQLLFLQRAIRMLS